MADRAVNTTNRLTATMDQLSPRLTDAIFTAIPTFEKLMEKGKVRVGTGAAVTDQIMYAKNSTFGWMDSVTSSIDVTPQEFMRNLTWSWKRLAGSVSIAIPDMDENDGDEKIVDLLQSAMDQAKLTMRGKINTALHASTQATGAIESLTNICSATTTHGGVAGTVGTYWQSTVTASGSFAAQGESDLRTMRLTITQGNDKPDFHITDKTTYGYYENSQVPFKRYTTNDTPDAALPKLMYDGGVVYADSDCTSGYWYMLNSNYLEVVKLKGEDFKFSPPVVPANQFVQVWKVLLGCVLKTNNRRMLGLLTGISA